MDLCELLEREDELIDIIEHEHNLINDLDYEASDTDIYTHERELKRVRKKILKKLHKEIDRRSVS